MRLWATANRELMNSFSPPAAASPDGIRAVGPIVAVASPASTTSDGSEPQLARKILIESLRVAPW